MENKLTAVFARLDITPPLGTRVAGYFSARYTKGVLDPLYVRAVAFGEGDKSAVVLSLDLVSLRQEAGEKWPVAVAERLGCAFLDASTLARPDPADGVHLDAAGHAALAQAVYEKVLELL